MEEHSGIPSRAELATRFRSNSDQLMRLLSTWNGTTPGAMARSGGGGGGPPLAMLATRLLSISDWLRHQHQHRHQHQQHISTSKGTGGVAPASKEAIEALKDLVAITGDFDHDQRPECAICLDQDDAAAGWKEMPCGHRFHGVCLEKWLRVHGTCPMCCHQLMPTAALAD